MVDNVVEVTSLPVNEIGEVVLEHPGSLNNHKIYATFSFWTS